MKRKLCVLMLLVGVAMSGYSLIANAGFGTWFGISSLEGNCKYEVYDVRGYITGYDSAPFEMDTKTYGGFLFMGAGFFEFTFGFIYEDVTKLIADEKKITKTDFGFPGLGVQLGVYLKWPIPIGSSLVFFPVAGVSMEAADFSLWLRGGGGLDVFFDAKTFIRGQFVYGLTLSGNAPREAAKYEHGHGMLISIALGWMWG